MWSELGIIAARKRCVISLVKKLEILEALKSGKSLRLVSNMFEVPKPTVGEILSYLASGH